MRRGGVIRAIASRPEMILDRFAPVSSYEGLLHRGRRLALDHRERCIASRLSAIEPTGPKS